MALPGQESTKNNLKWVLLLKREGSLSALSIPPAHSRVHHRGVLLPLPLRWPCSEEWAGASSFWAGAKLQEKTRRNLPWALRKQVPSNPFPLYLTSLKILFNPHTQCSVATWHRTNKKKKSKKNPISINFLLLLENHLCNFAAFPFNPTDRIMFICLKHCICCDYHKTSSSGRHGPLPIFNRESLSLQPVFAAADTATPNPTAPAHQHPAAQNKKALPVHLGTGVLESCPPPLLHSFGQVFMPMQRAFSAFHTHFWQKHSGTTAAWHTWVHLEPSEPHQHPMGQGRAPGEGCKLVATNRAAPQPLSCVPAKGLGVPCCSALGSQGTPFSLLCLCLLFPEHSRAPRLYLHGPQHFVSL